MMMEDLGVFTALTALVLGVVRYRFTHPSALNLRRKFGSDYFSDKNILDQLISNQYQTRLEEHNWPELASIGPCFRSLAESMLQGHDLSVAIESQTWLHPKVKELLLAHPQVVAQAMREIAESYLARGLKIRKKKADKEEKSNAKQVPDIVLDGSKGKSYKPVKFLASGSAGAVYTAVRVEYDAKLGQITERVASTSEEESSKGSLAKGKFLKAVGQQLRRQLALKRIAPTQKASAENEYRIASILAANDVQNRCVAYLDRADESPEHLWLVLRRISGSPYGIDLSEYISAQFFQSSGRETFGQSIVLQLLDGLNYISSRGICMRDVKPDNVLIEQDIDLSGREKYFARWSDFGLSIDMGEQLNGSGIRSPLKVTEEKDEEDEVERKLHEMLVGFWYDTQKLVPKPKWQHRRPPEGCFQNPRKVHVSAYDIYMLGIIFFSMACGIDIPHIDKASVKSQFEEKFNYTFAEHYLESFEVGSFVASHHNLVSSCFEQAFGSDFGKALLRETVMMLALDPRERPRPSECYARLESMAHADILK